MLGEVLSVFYVHRDQCGHLTGSGVTTAALWLLFAGPAAAMAGE